MPSAIRIAKSACRVGGGGNACGLRNVSSILSVPVPVTILVSVHRRCAISVPTIGQAQLRYVVDDTTAVGIEKHYLHFGANAGRVGYGHIGVRFPNAGVKATLPDFAGSACSEIMF